MPKTPRRVTACGFQTGLTVLVRSMIHDYHTTFFSSYGVRIFVHDPYDFLDDNAETKAVSAKMEAFMSLSPESTYSTTAVGRLAIPLRNCLFVNEKRLNVFQRYSYVNCLAECRSDMILELCGCIPHHLPNNGMTDESTDLQVYWIRRTFNLCSFFCSKDPIRFVKWTRSDVWWRINICTAALCHHWMAHWQRWPLKTHHAIACPTANCNNILPKLRRPWWIARMPSIRWISCNYQ